MSRFVATSLVMEQGYNWNMLLMKHVVLLLEPHGPNILLIKEKFLCSNYLLKIVDNFF